MKTPILLLILALILSSHAALAQRDASPATDTGTRGGGESVDISGRPVLRDLVDRTVCTWRNGSSMIGDEPRVSRALAALANHHWYLAFVLEREIRSLHFCVTESLVRVSTADSEGLTIYVEDTDQAAIRLNGSVYLNQAIYRRMAATSRAYLLIHEALHSFLPRTSALRNSELRSIIHSMEQLERGRMTGEEFAYQLEMNHISLISSTAAIDAYRDTILAALSYGDMTDWGTEATRERRLQNLRMASQAFAASTDAAVRSHILSGDEATLQRLSTDPTCFDPSSCVSPNTRIKLRLYTAPLGEELDDVMSFATAPEINIALGGAAQSLDAPRFTTILAHPLADPRITVGSSRSPLLNLFLATIGASRDEAHRSSATTLARLLLADPRTDINAAAEFSLDPGYFRGATPLILAAHHGLEGFIPLLLARSDLNPNAALRRNPAYLPFNGVYLGATALHIALFQGRTEIVRQLMADRRTDINAVNESGNSILHILAENPLNRGTRDALQAVFTAGPVNATLVNTSGRTALQEVILSTSSAAERFQTVLTFTSAEGRARGVDPLAVVARGEYEGQNLFELTFQRLDGIPTRFVRPCAPSQSTLDLLAPLLSAVTTREAHTLLTSRGPNGTLLERARAIRSACAEYTAATAPTGDHDIATWDTIIRFIERETAHRE